MVFRYIPEAYEINMVISIKLYCVIASEYLMVFLCFFI